MNTDDNILNSVDPVILVGAAPVQIGSALQALPKSWPVIAADGGGDVLLKIGRRPDLVIGDMDSAGELPDDLPQLSLAGQDDTDFEKCLSERSVAGPS